MKLDIRRMQDLRCRRPMANPAIFYGAYVHTFGYPLGAFLLRREFGNVIEMAAPHAPRCDGGVRHDRHDQHGVPTAGVSVESYARLPECVRPTSPSGITGDRNPLQGKREPCPGVPFPGAASGAAPDATGKLDVFHRHKPLGRYRPPVGTADSRIEPDDVHDDLKPVGMFAGDFDHPSEIIASAGEGKLVRGDIQTIGMHEDAP